MIFMSGEAVGMTKTLHALASVTVFTAVLSGCSAAADESGPVSATATSAPAEQPSPQPRLALSYEGGVMVVDATTLRVVDTLPVDGFTRLNPAGDGRHVLVTAGSQFRVLDTGTWSQTHGDHAHHRTAAPAVADWAFDADEPGHVVRHAGRTTLFADGSGEVVSFDPADLAAGRPDVDEYSVPIPHHGVAVTLPDGGLITTIGDDKARTGIVVLDRDRREIARNEQCPGVHGEAAAADETFVFGCQDGILVVRDGVITKVQSPDAYGRIGNQAGSEASPIVLGDYKTDPDAELERPQRVMLVDTVAHRVTPVDLGASYSFRSLGRGPDGEGVVLGTDGALHVIDPESGAVSRRIAVVDPWTEPERWQDPRPTLFVEGATAYVTDPARNALTAVNLHTGETVATTELPETPNELTGVTG